MPRTPSIRPVDTGHLLTSSLDYDTTLRRVARLSIPTHADWCMVYAPPRERALTTRLAIAHANPIDEAALRAVWQRQPFELPARHPLLEVVRTQRPIVVEACVPPLPEDLAGTPEGERVLRRVGIRSYLALPLVAHDACVGALMLVASRARRRPYAPASLASIASIASAAAHAIYNARLFSEARLALRLRDAVINAASDELLGLMNTVRERTQRLRWKPELAPAAGEAASVSRAPSDIDALADQMEQLIGELRLVASGRD